ncbi:MAG TPA: class I SAM-dependent methyltransferase [Azospirillaceae bacterium]|nr:class I SAM-dependent methyltransferase [Azospirillaceae bacterium]
MTDPVLSRQYEGYPYPARDPRDEARRLVTGSPSHRDELNHFLFGGRLDFARPLRILVAGGGTGDATVMLAQQFADVGSPATILHLDLSAASIEIARARVAARGLSSVTFRQGSLLDLGPAGGPFDYIDCCGVLHHLEDPDAGLKALERVLAPGGGMGVMVYAPYGRTGVYPLQDALRQLAGPDLPDAERIDLSRRLLRQLPATNGFRRNPHLADHAAGDAGLYDLLLHGRDRPYTVPELLAWVRGAGLEPTALIEPARYDPANLIGDPRLLKRLAPLDRDARWALAERLAGNIRKHIVYLKRPAEVAGAVAVFEGPDDVPVLRGAEVEALAKSLRPGAVPEVDLDGLALKLPLPRLAGPILARADGVRSFGDIHRAVDPAMPWDRFAQQAQQVCDALVPMASLFLRKA